MRPSECFRAYRTNAASGIQRPSSGPGRVHQYPLISTNRLAHFQPPLFYQSQNDMRYRELGKTGWKVSVLGYGAAPLGGAFGGIDEKDGIRSVHAALELGINFIEVSPDGGTARAE